ncbi:hypothetical protein BJ170DRAFT_407310 [Xylariales sp. AK1849]|nr:hypothetical protein BJ170DRAFT_407310 [Xylariales sp. AK1849]
MAILNQPFVHTAYAVTRAAEVQLRQASSAIVSSTISSVLSSATTTPSGTDTGSLTSITGTTSSTPFPTLNSDPAPTSTGAGNPSSGTTNSGTSSPLLFFVALGFGVVFTNLWIIVGVKYCFRYNARNRQMRGLDENGEPINLENMPTRPHRRRREKKLMTMEEVNDKFPMMKYKSWVADRAKKGLPTAGGVTVPPSRANSVRSVEGIVPEVPSKEQDSADDAAGQTPAPADKAKTGMEDPDTTTGTPENDTTLTQTQTAASTITKDPDHAHASDDEDDDDHINAAVPPELLATSGDTCAICIDTLEDDDDVRGLTCGHAFHAVCLDPWLTNRRACCPLCKADYYTPKPRPPPADGDTNNPTSPAADPARNNGRLNMPRNPQRTLAGWSFREAPRVVLNRYVTPNAANSRSQSRPSRSGDRRRPEMSRATSRVTAGSTPNDPAQSRNQQGWFSRARGRFPRFRQNGGAQPAEENASTVDNAPATPSQLEAGTRPS